MLKPGRPALSRPRKLLYGNGDQDEIVSSCLPSLLCVVPFHSEVILEATGEESRC